MERRRWLSIAVFVALIPAGYAQSLKVDTIAGQPGKSGYDDGIGAAAVFDTPSQIASDRAGNLYVTMAHTCVRKITPDGSVSTFAGVCGSPGSSNGIGEAARFEGAGGITTDADGNVYVADGFDFTIRKITPDRVVTTLAGISGSPGPEDGPPGTGRFIGPGFLAADEAGNIYVADYHYAFIELIDYTSVTIRKVTPTGVVTTVAGQPYTFGYRDGPALQAAFYAIRGLTVDQSGNLYMSNYEMIRKLSTDGIVSTVAGGSFASPHVDGPFSIATFTEPQGLVFDSQGNLFVIDGQEMDIRRLGTDGQVTTVAGKDRLHGNADGTGTTVRIEQPHGMTITPDGALYFVDSFYHTIRRAVVTRDGDANGDGVVTVADILYLINHLFVGGPRPVGLGDMNRNGTIEAADVFYLINYVFRGGPPP